MKTLNEIISRQRPKPPSIADFPRSVGDRLRRQRVAFDWRQSDLAERAGVSVQTIKAMEKGEAVSYENLLRLLLVFGHARDFLQILEAPNFPDLRAHERFLELEATPASNLAKKRVRPKVSERP
jgi:transcriptional regulator with XRE-family HTH domain